MRLEGGLCRGIHGMASSLLAKSLGVETMATHPTSALCACACVSVGGPGACSIVHGEHVLDPLPSVRPKRGDKLMTTEAERSMRLLAQLGR